MVTCRSRARANGSTTTFRRPSLATNLSHQRDVSQGNNSATNQNSGVYVPPHMSANVQPSQSRNGAADTRYSKDQLLDIFRAQSRTNAAGPSIRNLYVDGWNPHTSKVMTNGGWSAKDGHEDGLMGSDICWDQDGKVQPLGLFDMTEQEKEVRWDSCSIVLEFNAQLILGLLYFSQLSHQAACTEHKQRWDAERLSPRKADFYHTHAERQLLQRSLSYDPARQQAPRVHRLSPE